MPDYDDLLKQAAELGAKIAKHPRVAAYVAAQKAAKADVLAQQAMREYQAHLEHIQRLETAGRPVEVADKHKLANLETLMISNEALKGLMRAQADYIELMNQINAAIDAPMHEQGAVGAAE